jgi:hypothetical protein
MQDLKEFIEKLKNTSKEELIYLLDLEREILSETDESDVTYKLFQERILLYQEELSIRDFFLGKNKELSTKLTVVELSTLEYQSILYQKVKYDKNSSLYNLIIESQRSNPSNEIILCAIKNNDTIIDLNTLISNDVRFSFKKLASLNGIYPEYNNISELPHLFWNYILKKSELFHLFKEISSALLDFFNKEKINDSIKEGLIYHKWDEVVSLRGYLENVETENKFINFSLEVQIYNHTDQVTKWYCFNLDKRYVKYMLGDEGSSFDLKSEKSINLFEDYNSLFSNELSLGEIDRIIQAFKYAFTFPLPNSRYHVDLKKDFIHVLNFNFDLEECNSWTKY